MLPFFLLLGLYNQINFGGTGNTQYLTEGFQGSSTDFGSIATAFYYGLWSYGGWYIILIEDVVLDDDGRLLFILKEFFELHN